VVLVTKDINMRLKARACGIAAEDYSTDQLVDDVSLLPNGYHTMTGSFWDRVSKVETRQDHGRTWHQVQLIDNLPAVHINEFIIDEQGFVGWIKEIEEDKLLILDLHQEPLLHQEAWGLKPRDIYQSLALYALLDPDIHLVNLTGAAGSGKTILALAAAIEQTMVSKRYRRIIATRSVQGLDQEIGFLPGTEAEKWSRGWAPSPTTSKPCTWMTKAPMAASITSSAKCRCSSNPSTTSGAAASSRA
jgi:PhoH-like ATPase